MPETCSGVSFSREGRGAAGKSPGVPVWASAGFSPVTWLLLLPFVLSWFTQLLWEIHLLVYDTGLLV